MISKLQTELKDLRKDQHHQRAKHGEQMMNMVRSNDAQEKATHKNDEKIKLYDAKVRKVGQRSVRSQSISCHLLSPN